MPIRVETSRTGRDQYPTLFDDRVGPFLDDDQRRAHEAVLTIYATEHRRGAALAAILGGAYPIDPPERWRGPQATAARAEDQRKAEAAVRAGKPVPRPEHTPALRGEVARLVDEAGPIVTVVNERLGDLERALVAGRDGLVARIDAAIADARSDPADNAEQVLDLCDLAAWATRLPDRLDVVPFSNRERIEVQRARAVIAEAPDRAVAAVRALLTDEVPA